MISANYPQIVTAHPASVFGPETAELLSELSGVRAVAINPTLGRSLEEMVDELEHERRKREYGRWWFWGMSGGGWLAELYAHRYPEALAGVIIESACVCFRARLGDETCLISPHHPMWREKLIARGLYAADAHARPRAQEEMEWQVIDELGEVFRVKNGPVLLMSPGPQTPEMRAAMPALYTFDARAWINSLRLPALVIAGASDPIVPVSHVRAVHEAIPGSRFLLVEGAGHVPAAERRPEVRAAVCALLARASS